MSRLNLRNNPGKVVLERSEGVSSCLRERSTAFAAGVQHLFPAPHEIRTLLFFRPHMPIHTGRTAIPRPLPSKQAVAGSSSVSRSPL